MDSNTKAAAERISGGWMDIETAPKDGRHLLVFDGCCMAVAKFTKSTNFNPIVMALAGDSGYWQLVGSAFGIEPTHWMKLPEPPALKGPVT